MHELRRRRTGAHSRRAATQLHRALTFTIRTGLLAAVILSLGAGLDVGTAGAASAPAPAGSAHPGGSCPQPAITVEATRRPRVNQERIQAAIDAGQASGRCVVLRGQFDVGVCVFCIQVTGPVTILGQGDPTGPLPNPRAQTVVRATGGVGILGVNQPPDGPAGLVRISGIWWRGGTLAGLGIQNFYRGTLQFDHNRVTDVRERARFRFGIAGSSQILPGSDVLTGDLIVRDNYVDMTTNPFIRGDDNAIALQGATFNTIDFSRNVAISNGESIEIEFSTGSNYNISDNVISSTRRLDSALANVVNTVGYPDLHGGHPSAIKMAGNDVANMTIRNNHLTVGGGSSTMVCILQYMADSSASVHDTRSTEVSGNRCAMDGIFAGLLGGWAGERPFFPQGTLDDAVVRNNTFTGTAAFGMTMMDFTVPRAPVNDLINTSHGNNITANDFTGFTPSVASLYLGVSTHDNRFEGNPHGPVINLGTNNQILATP